jgi:phosphonate transport system substrate-binding protein
MQSSRIQIAVVLSLLFVFFSPIAPAAEKQTVRLGLTEKRETLRSSFGGILDHLKTSDAYAFEITAFPDYDSLYEAFKAGKIDLALVGAVKYAEAHFETGAIPVIAEGGMVRSVIIVRKDSAITDLKGVVGGTFAMGYEGSTSTHLMPLLLLSKNLVKESDLGKVQFVGADQHKIVEHVLSGKADAAGVVESVFDEYRGKLRAIETSDPFPGSPLIAHKDADPALIEAVRKLFLSYKPVEGQRFSSGAIAVTNTDFNQIRFLCKVVLGKSYV